MKIVIIGYGKMGHLIEKTAIQSAIEVVHIIDQPSDWDKLKTDTNPIVAIEFSEPNAAPHNIIKCASLGIPVVCGTTGWFDRLPEIKNIILEHNSALVFGSNFSVGVNIWFYILEQATKMFDKTNAYNIRLNETHHIHKLDAPSGTAIKAASILIDHQKKYKNWELDGSNPDCIHVNAKRDGEIAGIHEVIFESDEDFVTISHEAKNRQGFATGAVMAARWIQNKKGVFDFQNIFQEVLKINNK